jgi:hypothetical protein
MNGSHGTHQRSEGHVNRKQGIRLGTMMLIALAGAAVAACDDDPAPLFEIAGTGAVEGFVFFDADRNGIFDPSAGDYVLPDARVELRERGTQQTLAGGTATAGSDGRFVIANVRPGTHDLVVDTLSIPAGTRFCQNPVPVDVRISETSFRNLSGRIACIVTIAEAEQTRDQTVVIQGIVTSFPAETRSQYTYIQDETGGIRIFSSVLEGRGIERGDLIEVTGVVLEFSRDLQLGGTVVLGAIQKNVQQVTPLILTTGALAAAAADPASPELGVLVTLRGVMIETTFGSGGINGRNVWINDGSGRAQIRFETNTFPAGSTAEAQTQLNALYPVGSCYDVTGVTGLFNNDAQVFPRTLADLAPVPCT